MSDSQVPNSGRFRIENIDGEKYLLDTTMGRMWLFVRPGKKRTIEGALIESGWPHTALVPIGFVNVKDAKKALTDLESRKSLDLSYLTPDDQRMQE